jgi:hypothetical protein
MLGKLLLPADLLGAVCRGALFGSLLGWSSVASWHLPFPLSSKFALPFDKKKQEKEKLFAWWAQQMRP